LREVGMKVYNNKLPEGRDGGISVPKTGKSEAAGTKDTTSSPGKIGSVDKVEISGKGKEIAELMASINQLPEVRTDKVDAVRKAIEAGNYSIDPMKIAQKMLHEI
jgi:negative regulator of flagellin synthesis FlgM